MRKKCVVCDAPAQYRIKDTSEFYCKDCAEEHFADLQLLVTLEEEAQRLKEYIREKYEANNYRENQDLQDGTH